MTWRILEGDDLRAIEVRLQPKPKRGAVVAMVRETPFYQRGMLLRVRAPGFETEALLVGDGPIAERIPFPLDGLSTPIHMANVHAGIDLSTDEKAAEYLRFFTGHIHAEHGPFNVLDSLEGWAVDGFDRRNFSPVDMNWDALMERYEARAFVEYAGHLFRAQFVVQPDGCVEMIDDDPIGELRRLS